ncbi:hypothetical protein GBSOP10_106017 [Armatimonadetes bacterium GBS]|nr:MAG: hypothetical protein KatS3mg021_2343 [Fimbriimonadales bacterium]CUU09546.1 hypothetical protein GBSOP10_106017 [Armatimonadetes bacterium GBS]CUU35141.1 hypothetical protein GXSOP10_119184 [Armatimonadetes bacterium GXS]
MSSDLWIYLFVVSYAALVGVGLTLTARRYRRVGRKGEVMVFVGGFCILYGVPLWVKGIEIGYVLTLIGGAIAFLADLKEWVNIVFGRLTSKGNTKE